MFMLAKTVGLCGILVLAMLLLFLNSIESCSRGGPPGIEDGDLTVLLV